MLNELQIGGVYLLHDDEDGDFFRLCKIITISGNDAWISMHETAYEQVPSGLKKYPTITLRTSVESLLVWGTGNQSTLLHVESVDNDELNSRDFTLYPDMPLQRVDPKDVR